MKNLLSPSLALLLLGAALPAARAASMTVGSFDGNVMDEEIQSFNKYVSTLTPDKDNVGNNWAQGHSGEATKAIGLVYQIAGQQDTLDQMLRFCDAVLSQRNDLAAAPVGKHKIWTGDVAPVWPNDPTASPISTGGEQGDPVGHMANCGLLILKNKGLYNQKVRTGDPHGYGATYLDRAKTYIKRGDESMTGHILSRLLDLSNGKKMYFAKDSPYQPGSAVPWNQQMMFNYALQNLVASHRILGDNQTLLFEYKGIMQASLSWFFEGGGSTTKKSSQGNPVYDWAYRAGSRVEDSNHASLDVAGFSRAYIDGNWGITSSQMAPFANTFLDVMDFGNGTYAGTVEGACGDVHSACTTYIRSGFLFLAQFRPDAYRGMMSADLKEGGSTGSPDVFSRYLWVKHSRATS